MPPSAGRPVVAAVASGAASSAGAAYQYWA